MGGEVDIERKATAASKSAKEMCGYEFANHWPFAMPECHEQPSLLYRTNADRALVFLLGPGATPLGLYSPETARCL